MKTVFIVLQLLLLTSNALALSQNDLDKNLDHLQSQIELEIKRAHDLYQLRQVQLDILKEESKGAHLSEIRKVEKQLSSMEKKKDAFIKNAKKIKDKSESRRDEWKNKSYSDNSKKLFNQYKRLVTYKRTELASIGKKKRGILIVDRNFNQLLQNKVFVAYRRKLPGNIRQANRILAKREQEKAYDTYNKELVSHIKAQSITVPIDIVKLEQFANIDKQARAVKTKFRNAFPRTWKLKQDTQTEISTIIENTLQNKAIPAAKTYSSTIDKPYDAVKWLNNIGKTAFPNLAKHLSTDTREKVNSIFQARKRIILGDFIEQDKSKSTKLGDTPPRTQLERLVVEHNQFKKKYNFMLNEPQIQSYLKDRQLMRDSLLRKLEPSLIKSVTSATSINNLNVDLSKIVASDDKKLATVKRIRLAQKNKLNELMRFTPTKDLRQLSINSFTTRDLNYESEFFAIYLGDFSNSRLKQNTIATSTIFRQYLEAYGKYCDAFLPKNKVQITYRKCATESVQTDGWGNELSRSCVKWVDIPTGYYADPILYSASNKAESNSAGEVAGATFGALLGGDPFAARALADDIVSLGDDMARLVKNNTCANQGLERFETNLYHFVTGKDPLLLPGRESLASVRKPLIDGLDTSSLDLRKLLNSLISENSRGWALNRYVNNSVTNINSSSRPSDGSITSANANYRYQALGQQAKGTIKVTFSNKIPQCLYFSDAPQTCRKPSRRIINKYEKGEYIN